LSDYPNFSHRLRESFVLTTATQDPLSPFPATIIRRFCACGTKNHCRCDLPPARSGWTVEGLVELRQLMREHASLETVALLTGASRRECNVALNALVGRTPAHALAALEARKTRQCGRNARGQRGVAC
jgi:hypothetical protein